MFRWHAEAEFVGEAVQQRVGAAKAPQALMRKGQVGVAVVAVVANPAS